MKENRQGCLSRFIRAQTNPLRRLSAPLAPNKKDAIPGKEGAIIMLAPIFSGEYEGVDNIILTSKYGKTKCAIFMLYERGFYHAR